MWRELFYILLILYIVLNLLADVLIIDDTDIYVLATLIVFQIVVLLCLIVTLVIARYYAGDGEKSYKLCSLVLILYVFWWPEWVDPQSTKVSS